MEITFTRAYKNKKSGGNETVRNALFEGIQNCVSINYPKNVCMFGIDALLR